MIKRSLPNFVTCLNLFSGCIACVMAFEANYTYALVFIMLSATFDFFDGLLAKLLGVLSPIGKDLDSLADNISFGLAPSLIVFSLFKEVSYPSFLTGVSGVFPYLAFILSIFSMLRLAKFNNDKRQKDTFVGLNVPTNAVFWAALTVGQHDFLTSQSFNAIYLLLMVFLFSGLLVSEIPMFSMKIKAFTWQENKYRLLFFAGFVVLVFFLKVTGLAASVVWYILLSLFIWKKA